jgi:hypothetical protein
MSGAFGPSGGGAFNPAAPGPIGLTTPSTIATTGVTVTPPSGGKSAVNLLAANGTGVSLRLNESLPGDRQFFIGPVGTTEAALRVSLGAGAAYVDGTDSTGSVRNPVIFGTSTSNVGFGGVLRADSKAHFAGESGKWGATIEGPSDGLGLLQARTAGSEVFAVTATGSVRLRHLAMVPVADADAPNNGLFLSSVDGTLRVKNAGGTVRTIG